MDCGAYRAPCRRKEAVGGFYYGSFSANHRDVTCSDIISFVCGLWRLGLHANNLSLCGQDSVGAGNMEEVGKLNRPSSTVSGGSGRALRAPVQQEGVRRPGL